MMSVSAAPRDNGKRAKNKSRMYRMQHLLLFNFLPQSRIDGSSFKLCVLYDGMAFEPGPASAPAAEAPVESMVAWLTRGEIWHRSQ